MATAPPSATYDSDIDLSLANVPPEIEDPILYQELVDVHNALENLTKGVGLGKIESRIIVKDPADLLGDLDSSKQYFLDGVIDMEGDSIIVPAGGLSISGLDFGTSKLISSVDSYTMFTSPVGGSGNILFDNFAIEVTGTSSQVYDITGVVGGPAVEIHALNYNDCTSLGEIDSYRQGLESSTGRFGGQPTLTLTGAWTGGYRATTTIVRSLDPAMTGPLFSAGTAFVMQSRFLTDINADLGATASLLDFAAVNFPNASTLELRDCIITRNGVINAEDLTIVPNITAAELSSSWSDNHGIDNTFEGGTATLLVPAATVIATIGVFKTVEGSYILTDDQHFTLLSNRLLQHQGENPRAYNVYVDFTIEGTANDQLTLRLRKYDASAAAFVTEHSQDRQINNFSGPTDLAFFNFMPSVTLDPGDYLFFEVANNTAVRNVTAKAGSSFKAFVR